MVSWVYSGHRVLQVKSLLSTAAKGKLSTTLPGLIRWDLPYLRAAKQSDLSSSSVYIVNAPTSPGGSGYPATVPHCSRDLRRQIAALAEQLRGQPEAVFPGQPSV